MDKEIHCEIVNEVTKYYDIPEETKMKLSLYTQKPDIKAFENIRNYELPPSDVLSRKIKNSIKWAGNAIIELTKWAHIHGKGAPEQFLYHFNIAFEKLMIDAEISNEDHEIGIKNLAYCLHYVVDIATPFHSKELMDIVDLETYSKVQEEYSKEEFNDYSKQKIIEILMFFVNHPQFENDVKNYWGNQELRNEYASEIKKAVNKVDYEHRSIDSSEMKEFFEEIINGLKQKVIIYYDEIQNAYLNEVDRENDFNNEIFDCSKKCIYFSALLIALVLSVFYDKKIIII
jgi:hypothetical protein